MNIKQIILLLLLTTILVVLFYILLDSIDRHLNTAIIFLISGVAVSDIFLLARLYLRFMNSSRQKP